MFKVDLRNLLKKKSSKKSKYQNCSEKIEVGKEIPDELQPQQRHQLLDIRNEDNIDSLDWNKEDKIDKEFKDRDEDENENEEDVQKILQDIEIPDFNFSIDSADDDNDDCGRIVDNGSQLQREEVFSKWYHPSKSEGELLQDLSSRLGVSSSIIRLTKQADTLQELLSGNHSIVLKKGPINFNDQDCELFLLTDGFIAVYQKINIYNPLESRYDTCHFWSDIEFVKFVNSGTLVIQMQSGESYNLVAVSNEEDLKSWRRDIEQAVTLHTIHDAKSTITDVLGWQYKLIHQSGYTAAVTGNMNLMGNPENLNSLDTYNQWSPLHYALQCEPCSAEIVEALLRMGADPNLLDGEGRSAMYYAERNKLSGIEKILKENGGRTSKLAELEVRGELFGGVDQAEKNTDERREIEQAIKDNKAAEAAGKYQSAQSQMNQNMAAMIKRGEKINTMDDKARQLNEEAKNYGKLASQLKDQMRIKKWYQF